METTSCELAARISREKCREYRRSGNHTCGSCPGFEGKVIELLAARNAELTKELQLLHATVGPEGVTKLAEAEEGAAALRKEVKKLNRELAATELRLAELESPAVVILRPETEPETEEDVAAIEAVREASSVDGVTVQESILAVLHLMATGQLGRLQPAPPASPRKRSRKSANVMAEAS